MALTGNTETNILACLTAKRMGVRKTVAMVENLDYVSMAESLDIGTIINKKAIASTAPVSASSTTAAPRRPAR